MASNQRQNNASQSSHTPLPVTESGCPVDALVSLIMGPWTAYIVWVLLQHDSIRFSGLLKEVHDISARVLTMRLRRLEAAGLVRREQHLGIPPHVSYQLTARGRELGKIMRPLEDLARQWFAEDQAQCPKPTADTKDVRFIAPRLHGI